MASNPDPLTSPLKVRAFQSWAILTGGALLISGCGAPLVNYWGYGETGWLTLAVAGLSIIVGLFVLVTGLVPVELIADDIGIHWRQFLVRRTYRWDDISSVGVGRSRISEPADSSVGRFFVQGRRFGGAPSIGINLKSREIDPGRAAYNRGFTGFDINIRADFRGGLTRISDEIQQRLEHARAART